MCNDRISVIWTISVIWSKCYMVCSVTVTNPSLETMISLRVLWKVVWSSGVSQVLVGGGDECIKGV